VDVSFNLNSAHRPAALHEDPIEEEFKEVFGGRFEGDQRAETE
jgi:hypothetical protein